MPVSRTAKYKVHASKGAWSLPTRGVGEVRLGSWSSTRRILGQSSGEIRLAAFDRTPSKMSSVVESAKDRITHRSYTITVYSCKRPILLL